MLTPGLRSCGGGKGGWSTGEVLPGKGGGAEEGGKEGGKGGGAEEGVPHDLGSTGLGPNNLWPLGYYKMAGHYCYYHELCADRRGGELGYLMPTEGQVVEVLNGNVYPGHAGNLYSAYVFAEPWVQDEADRNTRRGWVPIGLLQPLDGWAEFCHNID